MADFKASAVLVQHQVDTLKKHGQRAPEPFMTSQMQPFTKPLCIIVTSHQLPVFSSLEDQCNKFREPQLRGRRYGRRKRREGFRNMVMNSSGRSRLMALKCCDCEHTLTAQCNCSHCSERCTKQTHSARLSLLLQGDKETRL